MPVLHFTLIIKQTSLLLFILVAVSGAGQALAANKAQQIHASVISGTPLYDDLELAALVRRVGEKLGRVSSTPHVDFKFYVLDDPGINAFTPGYGLIYINRGLLTYMTSEGQLASVLAHEIGHNTENHIGRQKSAIMWDRLASLAASLATGNSAIGNSLSLSNQARIKSFGREMELEADERGAEFMYKANYDPEEMLGMLGILTDHERFNDLLSLQEGGDATYHGVFSSHPRGDKRLQEIVRKAGTLPPGESFRGRDAWREVMDKVVIGTNHSGNKVPGYDRFINESLGITFIYPNGWARTVKGPKIVLKDKEKTVQLKITAEKTMDKDLASKSILEAKYPGELSEVGKLHKGHKEDYGSQAKRSQQRVAAIQSGRYTYHFQGLTKNNQLSEDQDQEFLKIIRSFRLAVASDLSDEHNMTIYYQRWKPGDTFEKLAEGSVLGPSTEDRLRLMNGYFPTGQPEPGMWVKLVKLGKPIKSKKIARTRSAR